MQAPLLDNGYGTFDPTTGAYLLRRVDTPRPWANVLANERYGLVLSQAGGGFSWFENCQIFRLNRWEQDLVRDDNGRYLYLAEDGEVWGTTYLPTRAPWQGEVRHEPGATTFTRTHHGIRTEHVVFVPREAPCEHGIVRITNLDDRPRTLQIGFYLEWQLGSVGDWHREFHRLFSECRAEGDTLLAWKHPGLVEGQRQVLERPVHAFARLQGLESLRWTSDKATFLGNPGNQQAPAALTVGSPMGSSGRWDDPIAGALGTLTLQPGETRTLLLTLGAEADLESARALAAAANLADAEKELALTREHWRTYGSACRIETPDPALDLMVNTWLPYQAVAGRMMARCAYYQQGGAYGYRDQLQDSLMLLASDPARTLTQLGYHAEAMYEDGGVRHWWHPRTDVFVHSHHSDTCSWLAFGVLAYLNETDDLNALDLEFSLLQRATERPGPRTTLLDHCARGLDRALERRSPRGLPLIGAGDWNDGLSHVGLDGKGESIWMGMFLYLILRGLQPYLSRIGRLDLEARYNRAAEELRVAVNAHGWDGEWYIAGTRDDGRPFGSRENSRGKLFLNPQTWAVLSGIAPLDRLDKAMQAVRERLVQPYGALLLAPAYDQVDPNIGYITRYAPGLRENGGVYSHAATWAVAAFAKHGLPDVALQIARGCCPPLRSALDPDLYAAEPFVMPGNVDGPDSPFQGRAGWTWYTGSAAWMKRVIVEHLCGVRAEGGQLVVDPALPTAWDQVRVIRPHRGQVFEARAWREGAAIKTSLQPLT